MRLHTFRKKGRLFHCLVKNEIIIIPIECHSYVKVPILSSFVRPIVKREIKARQKEGRRNRIGETSKSNIDSRLCARRASRDAGPPLLSDYSH